MRSPFSRSHVTHTRPNSCPFGRVSKIVLIKSTPASLCSHRKSSGTRLLPPPLTVARAIVAVPSHRTLLASPPKSVVPDLPPYPPSAVPYEVERQSSGIKPPLEYGDDVPDFAKLLTNASPEEELAEHQASLCNQAFQVCAWALVPKLWTALKLDQDLSRPFCYCHRTWKYCITSS